MNATELAKLREQCTLHFPGFVTPTPADYFKAMAQWCEANQVLHDSYGEGDHIQAFEAKIAGLLGMEAAVVCVTGTLAQATALRLASAQNPERLVGLHPSSHIFQHENSNHELLEHFHAIRLGTSYRPWTVDDLRAIPDRLAAVQYELPMREIGGQLPSWEQLSAIKEYCNQHAIHLHMDGARLWQVPAAYQRTLAQIAQGFDSVYVSLYKDLGGMSGAVLAGSHDFIARARSWMHRLGGSVFRRTPIVAAAELFFDQRLALMPALHQRTQEVFDLLQSLPRLQLNPSRPHCNMFHIYLPFSREEAIVRRNRLANEHGIWLFHNALNGLLEHQSMIEWTVGDHLLNMPDGEILRAMECFLGLGE